VPSNVLPTLWSCLGHDKADARALTGHVIHAPGTEVGFRGTTPVDPPHAQAHLVRAQIARISGPRTLRPVTVGSGLPYADR